MAESVVMALFTEVSEAAGALRRLRDERQTKPEDTLVLSAAPFPEGVLEVDTTQSRLPLITVVFALIGIVVGILLAGGTALLYVLRQGGKPILSGPPIAIIAYEVMMLSALTAAFVVALREMRLPSWKARVYDPRISEGLIGIAARCESDQDAGETERLLTDAGAVSVRRDARSLT
jgi:hypothetical protein